MKPWVMDEKEYAGTFDEAEHPRADDGKFAEAPGSSLEKVLPHPKEMRGSDINKELDHLEKVQSKLNDEMIETGRGMERPSEWLTKSDPLARRLQAVHIRKTALQIEVGFRYGPNPPGRLPRGVGAKPRVMAEGA